MKKQLINISGRENEKCTEIVPDDFQHTTYMDVGSAENEGSIFGHSIRGDK